MKLAAVALALAACSSTPRSPTTPNPNDDNTAKYIVIGVLAVVTLYALSQAVDTDGYKPNQ
jgi:hypothetical protein